MQRLAKLDSIKLNASKERKKSLKNYMMVRFFLQKIIFLLFTIYYSPNVISFRKEEKIVNEITAVEV